MDELKIYIDRLKGDVPTSYEMQIAPSHFQIEEQELRLAKPVDIKGTAYRTSDHLIVDLNLSCGILTPCAICNELFSTQIKIFSLKLAIPLCEIRHAIYDLTDEVRTQILLKVPSYGECHQNSCPERKTLQTYLKPKKNLPFSELNL